MIVNLESYALAVEDPDWAEADLYRAIVCGLPRALVDVDRDTRRAILEKAPPLTGTHWDALLAAMAEHITLRDGNPLAPWMDEPARFLDTPWLDPITIHSMRWEAMWHAPAAFVRHGTPIHPSDLDERGGDPPWAGTP